MTLRGLRGATCLQANDADEMADAVGELIQAMMQRNGIAGDHVISIILTGTPDLTCAFPAAGARAIGLVDVPLLCAQEMGVDGALERVVRILMHVDTDLERAGIAHVYLRGAEVLRQDLVQ
ncbi:MAG: chorismate mutase [Actinomycetota bacterium]|nr:chorismate mutase [Actinomycetota bacterium]